MEGYLREALDEFPEEITGRVKIPEATHLFEFWSANEQVMLHETSARVFCHSVVKLLFTSTKCREYI